MDAEGKRAREMVKNLSRKEKLKHFWYYYKKHVIIAVIAVGFIGWTIWQKATEIKYDLQIPYYSSYFVDEENNIENLEKYFTNAVGDFNNNGRVDFQILPYAADLERAMEDQMVGAMLNKIDMTLAADEFTMYILDEKYLEYFKKSYPDITFTTVEISVLPQVQKALGLRENEKVYLITLDLFERLKDNEKKVQAYKNALTVEKYFADQVK